MDELESLAHVEGIIGRSFDNQLLGIEALNTGGWPIFYKQELHIIRQNDKLAILGDKAIDLVLGVMWYRSEASQDHALKKNKKKGDWTKFRDDLTTNANLAARGFHLGLDAYIIRNPGTTRISPGMMATALEAIIGAVFKDSGYDLEAVRAVMCHLGFFTHDLLSSTDFTSMTDPGTGHQKALTGRMRNFVKDVDTESSKELFIRFENAFWWPYAAHSTAGVDMYGPKLATCTWQSVIVKCIRRTQRWYTNGA